MARNKPVKTYLYLVIIAVLVFLLHAGFNTVFPFLNGKTELPLVHIAAFMLYISTYWLTIVFRKKNPEHKPMVILMGYVVKLILAMVLVLVFYLTKNSNTEPFILSFFAVYMIYLAFTSYFYIKELK